MPPRILAVWRWLGRIPYIGAYLFTWAISLFSPYTGTVPLRFTRVSADGAVTATMRQTRRIMNPFGSVHLAALVNAGEACTAISVTTMLEERYGTWIAIPKGLRACNLLYINTFVVYTHTRKHKPKHKHKQAEFMKKARGKLRLACTLDTIAVELGMEKGEFDATTEIHDETGDLVSRVCVTWALREKRKAI